MRDMRDNGAGNRCCDGGDDNGRLLRCLLYAVDALMAIASVHRCTRKMVNTILPKCNNLRGQSCWRCAWWLRTRSGYRLNYWNRVLVDGPVLLAPAALEGVRHGKPPAAATLHGGKCSSKTSVRCETPFVPLRM